MANIKTVFLDEDLETGIEVFINANKKIAIDITSGNQFNVAVIELNIDTAIKLSKELRRQIAILKNEENE